MAQRLANVQLAAPGFYGLNTEDSPVNQTPQFCQLADNAVIDAYGRIGARKAFATDTTTWPTLSGRAAIDATPGVVSTNGEIHHMAVGDINGAKHILCLASEKGRDSSNVVLASDFYILKKSGTVLTELTLPVGVNDKTKFESGQIVAFNNKMYILSETNEIIVYDGTTLSKISSETGYYPIHVPDDYRPGATPSIVEEAPTPTLGLAAFGRLWVSGHDGDFQRVWYSDLNIAQSWYDNAGTDPLSTAGYIDVSQFWPDGKDRIVGLAAHNNFLIMFGRTSILVWGNADGDPAAADGIFLSDTIRNIGCISRDAIINIGTDVLFLDDTGVRSLGRTVTQQSAPIGDLTKNIRRDITTAIASTGDNETIKGVYAPDENFCLFIFPESNIAYCLDLKSYLLEGTSKITRWTGVSFNDAVFVDDASSVALYFGSNDENGVLQYTGFSEYTGSAYVFRYLSNPLYLDQPGILKFPKVLTWTAISQNTTGTGNISWGFDRLDTEFTKAITIPADDASYYGSAEYNIDEYAFSPEKIVIDRVNTKGAGETITLAMNVNIAGNSFSLQELNLQALIGRLR